jgi:predicted ATPase
MPSAQEIRLTPKHVHRSLGGLEAVTLSNPAFISGLNGAGKTHLLQAIEVGAVEVTIGDEIIATNSIKLYDWTTFAMRDAGVAQWSQVYASAESHWSQIERHLYGAQVTDAIRNFRANHSVGLSDQQLMEADLGADLEGVSQSLRQSIEALRVECTDLVLNNSGAPARRKFELVHSYLGKNIHRVSAREFIDSSIHMEEMSDPLQHQLSQLFLAYKRKQVDNENAFLRATHLSEDIDYTDDATFLQRFGRPPWEVLNDALRDLGLRFVVVEPGSQDISYKMKLKHEASDMELDLGALSSGERILLALAVSLYGMSDQRHLVRLPRLMLFDEVDAPLHPAMVRSYLRTIDEFLVAQGVAVIATTHSPSTVALCPPGLVWGMAREAPRLVAVTNQHALSTLTAGVSALDIRYQDRRQVFVESQTDAEIYELIYERVAADLALDIGLVFVPASGQKSDGGAVGVYSMVEALRGAGVNTAFGVVDWDLHNSPSDDGSVLVLGAGQRYSIENYLFDPLLIAALLVREKKPHVIPGLEELLGGLGTWRGLGEMGSEELQCIVEVMLAHLEWGGAVDRSMVNLVGGSRVTMPSHFITRRGHDLHPIYFHKVPALRQFSDEHGLRRAVASRVIAEIPGVVPTEIWALYATLGAR